MPASGLPPRAAAASRLRCALLLLLAVLPARPGLAAVPPGDYCVSGLGATLAGAVDGWLATVTPAGVVTNQTPAPAVLVDPWDCAVDPTNGDVIVVDEGNAGGATDGAVYRVTTGGGAPVLAVVAAGAPLVNPLGVAVGSDGTIYVADVGASFGAAANGAVYAIAPGGGAPVRLDTGGVGLADPTDVDVDPRPFTGASPGLNLAILELGGAIQRVPIGGGNVVNVSGGGTTSQIHFEVGPYGSYYIADLANQAVLRFDRPTGGFTTLAAGAPLNGPIGFSVDYFTGDLVVANAFGGLVNVPPGNPAPTAIPAGPLPGSFPVGMGFSPPLASTLPAANLGTPTRRAPIPGSGGLVIGPGQPSGWGDVENQIDVFIEVTSTAAPLEIRLFDANVRDGLDRDAGGGGFNTATQLDLFDPAGTLVASHTIAANGRADLDMRIATLSCATPPCDGVGPNPLASLAVRGAGIPLGAGNEGLYRLRIQLPGNNDLNAFGLWVDGFNAYSHAPIYGITQTTGSFPRFTPLDPFRLYPYFDRGCEFTASNFDWDASTNPGTSLTLHSREGSQTPVAISTPSNLHFETNVDPALAPVASPTPDGPSARTDYGLWGYVAQITNLANGNNYISERGADFNGWVDGGGTGPPIPVPPGNLAANPTPALTASPGPAYNQEPFAAGTNTFLRYYLPRYDETPSPLTPTSMDGAARPYAPRLMHSALPLAGDPPDPTPGVFAHYAVEVTLVNPDPVNAITNVSVTAPVPAPTQYVDTGPNVGGGAIVSGGVGGAVTPCAGPPCSGNVVATWTSIPPASAATLAYAVRVDATTSPQTLYLTEGPRFRGGGAAPAVNPAPPIPKPPAPAAMGTRASFTPAWSSASFPRTESLGPLCDLSVTTTAATPVAVELSSFEALAGDGEVLVAWETASEFENLGFHLHRRHVGGAGDAPLTRVNATLLLGRGTTDLAGRYAILDRGVENGVELEYWLEDVELDGTVTRHGPILATPRAGALPIALDPVAFDGFAVVAGGGAAAPPGAEPATASPAGAGAATAASPAPVPAASAAGPGLEIETRGAGLVEVGAAELLAAGLDPGVDPRSLGLTRQGGDVALRIEGEADGRLDAGDRLRFWSRAHEDRYTDREVYLLAPGPGPRAAALAAAPGAAPVFGDADALGRLEEQRTYLPTVLNGEGDNFVGAFVFDEPVVQAVPTPAALPVAGRLRVLLRGGTSFADVPEDHHFEVRVGGTTLLDVRFDGTEAFDATVPVPAALLAGDELAVEIHPRFDSGAPFDLIYVDALEVGYRRALEPRAADADRLVFEADADGVAEVEGVAAGARVWDVTDPDAPGVVEGAVWEAGTLRFAQLAGRRYAVVETPTAPHALGLREGSSWSTGGGADWVAIGPAELLEALDPLVALRESQGLATARIDVEQVYDELAGGRFSPPALRDLVLGLLATWDPAPRYLLLVGDASYDYRDFLSGSARNATPTMLLDTTFVESASDTWFGTPPGAPLALAVGRLPARDAAELADVVAKLVAYEADPDPAADWRRRLLLAADDGAGAGHPVEAERFEAATEAFAARAPGGFEVERVHLAGLPDAGAGAAANASLRAGIEAGAALVVYAGHGGARHWAEEAIFGADDLADLAPSPAPLFLALNCLNGFFDAPNEDSLAEAALAPPDRGAVAFVSSTTVSPFPAQQAFAEAFAEELLGRNGRRVGDVFLAAMQAIALLDGADDARRSLVLIGDPATTLALPEAPVADAGPDAVASGGDGVRLDGSASRPVAGGLLAFDWQVVESPPGSQPTLMDADTPRPWFWARTPGLYRVALVVSEGELSSGADDVRVSVESAPGMACGSGPGDEGGRASLGDLVTLLLPMLLARPLCRRRAAP